MHFPLSVQPISNLAYSIYELCACHVNLQDGRISYEEFAAMMKAGTDWRKASRQYSRERFNNLSLKLIKEGSLNIPSGVNVE